MMVTAAQLLCDFACNINFINRTDDLETLCSGNGYGLPDVIWERWQFTIAVLIWFYLISNTCWFQKHTYRYIPHTHTHMGNLTYTYIYGQQWYTTSSYKYWNGDWEAQFYAAGATSYRFIVLIAQTYHAAPHRITSLRTVCKQWLVLLMRALFACSGAFVCHGWSFLIEPLLLHQRI